MPNLSLRGLDPSTLARIKSRARRRGVSVNRLIVETLQREYGRAEAGHDDLDSLAGTWTKAEAAEFRRCVAPFGEIDAELWAGEPAAAYRVRRRSRARPSRK